MSSSGTSSAHPLVLTTDNTSGAAAYEAMKAYENHVQQENGGQPPSVSLSRSTHPSPLCPTFPLSPLFLQSLTRRSTLEPRRSLQDWRALKWINFLRPRVSLEPPERLGARGGRAAEEGGIARKIQIRTLNIPGLNEYDRFEAKRHAQQQAEQALQQSGYYQ